MAAAPLAFYVEIDAFPTLAKRDVDAGTVPAGAAEACDAIRAIFFTSNAMRKERDAWLYSHADRAIIRLAGSTLRYVGPDERSMLLLLIQARDVLASRAVAMPGAVSWLPSTPGIDVATGHSPGEAWSACLAAHPARYRLLPRFERENDDGTFLVRLEGDGASIAGKEPAIACFPLPGSPPPAPVETFNTLRVACKRDVTGPARQVLLLNLVLDNLTWERP